jgi:protein phosphatase
MKIIKILIGLPRSGKSTWIKDNKKEGEVILSADDLRYLVYNQRYWAEGESLVWSVRGIFLKYLLQQGVDIIIDETNTTKKARKNIIDLAKKYGYYITGIVIKNYPNECIKRAEKTNQLDVIPVIHHMAENFESPEFDEGFDEINWFVS